MRIFRGWGPYNALGIVKLVFPNECDAYFNTESISDLMPSASQDLISVW